MILEDHYHTFLFARHSLKSSSNCADNYPMIVFTCYAIATLAVAIAVIEHKRNN
jgi:hypothetical protein